MAWRVSRVDDDDKYSDRHRDRRLVEVRMDQPRGAESIQLRRGGGG